MTSAAELARTLADLERRIYTLERAPRVAGASVVGSGVTFLEPDGQTVRTVSGRQLDGTYGVVDYNGPADAIPTAPIVIARPGTLVVSWDGYTENDEGLPLDYARVEVHVAHADDAPGGVFEPTDENQVGEFISPRGGALTLAQPPGVYYVCLTLVNKSEAVSLPSVFGGPYTVEDLVTDGNPPETSPTPVPRPGIGSIHVSWEEIENNDDVYYDVFCSNQSGFTPSADNRVATGLGVGPVTVRALNNGDAVVAGTAYFVVIRASDNDGPGPYSAEVPAMAGQADTADIAVEAIKADQIDANAVTAAKLHTEIALIGNLIVGSETGRRVVMDPTGGFRVIDNQGATVFHVPTNMQLPISATAEIVAASLTAVGKVQLQHPDNFLGAGANFTLLSDTSGPAARPTVAPFYNSTELTAMGGQGRILFVEGQYGYHIQIYKTGSGADGRWAPKLLRLDLAAATPIPTTVKAELDIDYIPQAMVQVSTSTTAYQVRYVTISRVWSGTGPIDLWSIRGYDYLYNHVISLPYGDANTRYATPALAYDGTNLVILQTDYSTGRIWYQLWNKNTLTKINEYDTGVNAPPGNYSFSSAVYGTFDFGGGNPRVVALNNKNEIKVFAPLGVPKPENEWPMNYLGVGLLTTTVHWWAATGRFRAYDSSTRKIWTFGPNTWTDPAQDIHRISYAYGNNAGGLTPQSPRTEFAGIKRVGSYRVTVPTPYPTGVTKAYIYCGVGAGVNESTDRTTMHLQAGSTIIGIFDVVTPTYGGANPVLNGTIAGTNPAEILSGAADSSPYIQLAGSGTGRLGPLRFDQTSLKVGGTAMKGIVAIDGGAFSGTTNAAGDLVIPHNLGVLPHVVYAHSAGSSAYYVFSGALTASNFTVKVRNITLSNGAGVASTAVTVRWVALVYA